MKTRSRRKDPMNCMSLVAGAWHRVLFTFALMALLSPALADNFTVTPGLSAHWYSPERAGEGLVLEILDQDTALLYWFTYDEAGNQRWMLDVGEISGNEIVFPELIVTRGGRFGPDFDPDEVELEVIGSASLSFSDCDHGEFTYSAFGHNETLPMVRLSQTMAANCQVPHGVPGEPIRDYAGQSGSWYDPAHTGEGYTLQWMSRDEALVVWFSYDADGNQYWMTGIGKHEDGRIEFPMLHATRGGRFGPDFDPDAVELVEWGSLDMALECSAGEANYESPLLEFGSGSFELTRLTQPARPACPWVRPNLTDLYDITWHEIPNQVIQAQAWSIANDGTVAGGVAGGALALWRPEMGEWQLVEDREIGTLTIFVSQDGSEVIAVGEDIHQPDRVEPLIWRDETGWQSLPGLIFDRSLLTGVSQDFSRAVGHGLHFGDVLHYPWVWDAVDGQQELPLTEAIPGGIPTVVSNDGNIAVGVTLGPPIPGTTIPTWMGIRWQNGGEPEILRDHLGSALGAPGGCNHDCSLIFGLGQTGRDPDHPYFRQAWFMSDTGQFEYLGEMGMIDVSADGSMTVGDYLTSSGPRALIWTQDTGMTTVPFLIEELGIGDDSWDSMYPVDISPNGRRILLQGRHGNTWRAVVLKLELKK
jgi:hypothetical protein